jgi:hypothetical protein
MFLALIVALGVGVAQLHSKNQALAAQVKTP